MPKLPKYELTERLPTNLVTPDFGQKSGLGQLGREIGKVFQIRGEQLTREYDTVKVVSAYNAFSDSSRGVVKGLLELESGAAEGVQDAYKEWYEKNQNEFTGMLNNRPQQAMFKAMADRKRETDLNHLARHESTQYKVQKKEELDKFAVNADSDIRKATVEALKTPGKDFSKADEVIKGFMFELYSMFPGHDLTMLEAKYTQTLRIAQLEEMMEVDPQTAREYIEKENIKDDLSFIENGVLKDAYPALKSKLKEEESRDVVDTLHHAMISLHPTDPGEAIKTLYDEKKLMPILAKMGITEIPVAERDRVVNTFKAEIVWARNTQEQQRSERANITRQKINDLMAQGHMKQALDELDQSKDFLPEEQSLLWNQIFTRRTKYTDTDRYNDVEEKIINNKLKDVSEIDSYNDISDRDKRNLKTIHKVHHNNPGTTQFMADAFKWFDEEFAGPDMLIMQERRPAIRSWLWELVNDPKNPLRGPDIMNTLREQVGTRDDVYSKGWGEGGWFGWAGAGDETTRAAEGEKIERGRRERAEGIKRRKEGSEPVKPTFAEDEFADIPESAKAIIIKDLKRTGDATEGEIGEENILKMYQLNKDKFTNDIGITF